MTSSRKRKLIEADSDAAAAANLEDDGQFNVKDYLLDDDWKELLSKEFQSEHFLKINQTLKRGYAKGNIRPPKELIFNAFNSTKLKDIKVVILGQDPYHDDGQAHGLAFSVPEGIELPRSLKNIFKELESDISEFQADPSKGGCLQAWTQKGVFLLNTFLTVEAHKAGSHAKIGWEEFTNRVIQLVSDLNDGCVFILWGGVAHKKEPLIDGQKHKIIKTAHPSPMSAVKFFGSKCFSAANEHLKAMGKQPINWSL